MKLGAFEMPSLPGKRGKSKAAERDLAFGSKGNQKKLTEEMKRGSKQWRRVVEGMQSKWTSTTTSALCRLSNVLPLCACVCVCAQAFRSWSI